MRNVLSHRNHLKGVDSLLPNQLALRARSVRNNESRLSRIFSLTEYRPPSADSQYYDNMVDVIDHFVINDDHLIALGDLNIDC